MTDFNESDHPRGCINNAGSFTEKAQSAPESSLGGSAEPDPTYGQASRAAFFLDTEFQEQTHKALAEHVEETYGPGTSITVTCEPDYDSPGSVFVNVASITLADGEELDHDALDDDEVDTFARQLYNGGDPHDSFEKIDENEHSIDLTAGVKPTPDAAWNRYNRRAGEIRNARLLLDKLEWEDTRDVLASIATEKFPTAAFLLLEDRNDDGTPYWGPAEICDKDGNTLWESTDDDGELENDLYEFTPQLDRLGEEKVTITVPGDRVAKDDGTTNAITL